MSSSATAPKKQRLRRDLPTADFTGVLRGEALARAYADLDLFVFPSHTDTFGNVILEALASGVPAIVTPARRPPLHRAAGGNRPHRRGRGIRDRNHRSSARPAEARSHECQGRAYALTCSWDAVFDRVYEAYLPLLRDLACTTGCAASSSPG